MSSPQPTPDEEAGTGLGRKVRSGLLLSFLNNVVGRLGSLAAGILLARVLTPEQFGVFGVALVAMNLAMSLNDAGIAAGLVRWPGPFEDVAATAGTLILGGSALLAGVMWLAAPLLADQFGAPGATGVLRLLAVTVVIDGVFAVPTAALTRSFLQGRRMTADLLNTAASTAVTVALALLGAGAFSLAWGRVVGNLVSGLVIVALSPARVRLGWDRDVARRLLAFGAPLMGTSLLVFGMLNVDNLLVGRMLGPTALGYYALAFNLSAWPVFLFAFAARRVSLAGFAQLAQDPPRQARAFVRSVSLLLAVAVPFCVLLICLAEPLTRVLYGDTWLPSVGVLRWLAAASIVRIFAELGFDLLIARGLTRTVFALQLAWVAAMVPAIIIGILVDGVRGAAVGVFAVAVLVVLPGFSAALVRSGVPGRSLLDAARRPVLGGLLAAAGSTAVAHLLAPPVVVLVVGGFVGLALHAGVIAPLRRLVREPISDPATA